MSNSSNHESTARTLAKLTAQFGIGTVAGFKRTEVDGLECVAIKFVDGTRITVREVSKGVYKTVKEPDVPQLPEPPQPDNRVYAADHVSYMPLD